MELKASNDGKCKFSNEFSGLFKDVEGFEDSAVTTSGTVSAADGMKLDVGFIHNGKDHKFDIKASASKDPTV